ncbi:hypothetical protein PIB30_022942 [Stylosanthes scabra]|uniref:CCHC-type domain-containing protein n=1 Tax=Stylosanthes scabra TaxID=79078 RepID=A0ABU6R9J5_9FABA|nr:hypothetical protein [Stylosanthes scabra]
MGWGFSLRIFIRLFRYRFKAWKVGEASVKNSKCLAFSEGQVFRCLPNAPEVEDDARVLRYGALQSQLSFVAALWCEDVESFNMARNHVSEIVEKLRRRNVRTLYVNQAGGGEVSIKDSNVCITKGAPKKGKEPAPSQCEASSKKRCCTACGIPGHTKRTCTGRSKAPGTFPVEPSMSSQFTSFSHSHSPNPLSSQHTKTQSKEGRHGTAANGCNFINEGARPIHKHHGPLRMEEVSQLRLQLLRR